MTPPPNSIDGTDITGATIDGQEVQEITVDGQSVFTALKLPASGDLQARYDAREITASDGDSVGSWTDETGNGFDVTGNGPVYNADAISGLPAVRFSGADGVQLDVDFTPISPPIHYYALFRIHSTPNDGDTLFSGGTSNQTRVFNDSGEFRIFDNNGVDVQGGTVDQNSHILSAIFRSGEARIRIDGTEMAADTTAGSGDMSGFTMSDNRGDGGERHIPIDDVEVLLYDGDPIPSDVEAYLDRDTSIIA